MSSNETLKGIGKKLKDEARDLIAAKLPERLEELLRRLRAEEQAKSRRLCDAP